MSNITNTTILEDMQADFDTFLSQRNWQDAESLIENMDEVFPHEARILREVYDRTLEEYLDTPAGRLEYEEGLRPSYPNE